ncbi:acyltransferase [Erwinia amylovora]|uniref:acyltransferase family protein n=1 Tax=Erwinia amylovora TaxID=552 RepID=UPI0023611BA3|nr:acyltransferase [Erwinia amylovora]WDD20931.1 acyltransferase [Erwinia amylovora]
MNRDIQVLRCIAIIFVVFVHVGMIIPENFQQLYKKVDSIFHTNMGVELFFVIAGYFLSHSLSKYQVPDRKNGFEKILIFSKNIFKRLFLPVYFWAAIPMVMALLTRNTDLWYSPDVMIQKFLSTVAWMRDFSEAVSQNSFGYFWAVSLEMQTFLIFAAVYILAGKRIAVALSVVICFIMTLYRPGGEQFWWFRFDPVLFGVIAHYVLHDSIGLNRIKELTKCSKVNKAFISSLLILCLGATYNSLKPLTHFVSTSGSLISCVMLMLAVSENSFYTFLPSAINKVTTFIGDRSFSLFCCHIPSWLLVRQLFEGLQINEDYLFLAQVAGMIIFTELTFKLLEIKPNKRVF